jgi:hypothetical protein
MCVIKALSSHVRDLACVVGGGKQQAACKPSITIAI